MILAKYKDRVDLLLQVLPYVAKEKEFALKGGTAINLFERNMPRLSVDIDLHYLPIKERDESLQEIEAALKRIKKDLEKFIKGIHVNLSKPKGTDTDLKLNCQLNRAQIKIEVNSITRGKIAPERLMQINKEVQEKYGKFAAINVVSHGELFGGKILAALDRQHPRDLFDVKILMDNEGIDDNIRLGFITMLASHYKPIHELLNPELKDQKSAFKTQFSGMSELDFTYSDYEKTSEKLIIKVNRMLTKTDKKFLIGFASGQPDWSLCPIEVLKDLPAVKWKLININKLATDNPKKHDSLIESLKVVLKVE